MGDIRLKVLAEARRMLEEQDVSELDRSTLAKLLDILTLAVEKHIPEESDQLPSLGEQLINNQAIFSLLLQQADELDTLKKLSIHLTSSLDLPDVLDAVVTEAMRLIDNARDVNIFLYKGLKLSFGAALNADGVRNKPWSTPRSNGLTYAV